MDLLPLSTTPYTSSNECPCPPLGYPRHDSLVFFTVGPVPFPEDALGNELEGGFLGGDIIINGGEFTMCVAAASGGVIFVTDGARATITGGTFQHNTAGRRGAVVSGRKTLHTGRVSQVFLTSS